MAANLDQRRARFWSTVPLALVAVALAKCSPSDPGPFGEPSQAELVVALRGTGTGSVYFGGTTKNAEGLVDGEGPGGLVCPTQCSKTWSDSIFKSVESQKISSTQKLTATPNADSVLVGWADGCKVDPVDPLKATAGVTLGLVTTCEVIFDLKVVPTPDAGPDTTDTGTDTGKDVGKDTGPGIPLCTSCYNTPGKCPATQPTVGAACPAASAYAGCFYCPIDGTSTTRYECDFTTLKWKTSIVKTCLG
jgi:hypothetical protein